MSHRYDFANSKFKAMIYGKPGVGKTRLASSAALDPRFGKVLMLEAFGNPISIKDYPTRPDIITIEKMSDFNEPYRWLAEGQNPSDSFATQFELEPPYDTIIVDSLTEVQRLTIHAIQGGGYIAPGDMTPALGRQGFGQLLGTMLNWAFYYIGLDMNVVLVSHEQTQAEAPFYSRPLLWGQSGSELAGYVFMVMRLTRGKATDPNFRMESVDPLTDSTDVFCALKERQQFYAKSQYKLNVDHMTEPTMTKIMDLIEQSKGD